MAHDTAGTCYLLVHDLHVSVLCVCDLVKASKVVFESKARDTASSLYSAELEK